MNVNLRIPIQKLSLRAWMLVGLALVLLAGGALFFYKVWQADPPKPWVLKWRISSYLKKETGRSDFSIPFQFPSPAEMKKGPAHAKTKSGGSTDSDLAKKDFDTLKKEYIELQISALILDREADTMRKDLGEKRALLTTWEKQLAEAPADSATNSASSVLQSRVAALRTQLAALDQNLPAKIQAVAAKEKAVEPLWDELRAFQRAWAEQQPPDETSGTNSLAQAQVTLARDMRTKFGEANTYGTMYRLIGQQLWVADRLLGSANPEHRRAGLSIARQAGRDALAQTENGWLASSIYLAYVMPQLDLMPNRSAMDALVTEAADIFRRSESTGSLLGMYQMLLAQASTPQRADWARVQIAQVHEQAGELKEAISWLKQVKSTNDFAWAVRRISWMERRVQQGR